MTADPNYREYAPADWPDVEVLIDNEWLEGELHAWSRRDDVWYGHVQHRKAPGDAYLKRIPADQIRQIEPPD